jgi:5-methylcytosine-specific restriction endonuclease McrA
MSKSTKGFASKYGVSLLAANAFLRTVKLANSSLKIAERLDIAFRRHGKPRPDSIPIRQYCIDNAAFILETAKGHYKSNARKQIERATVVQTIRTTPAYSGDVNADSFLSSFEWRRLRMEVLRHYGPKCMCCGATPSDGAVMNIDHIKPRRTHPHLALDFDNLQVLCNPCNHGKGNWDSTDWRPKTEERIDPDVASFIRSIAQER